MYILKSILLGVFIFGLFACHEKVAIKASKEDKKEVDDWQNKRIDNLKKENGWLNLVGLYWLNEGENTFGANESNDIVFPSTSSQQFIGKIVKKDSIITTFIKENIKVVSNGKSIKEILMKPDITGNPTVLTLNSLKWFIIKRGDKYGVRLRDLKAKLLKEFKGIERFPTNENWKTNAKFEKFDIPKKILIPTILGTIEEDFSPGKLIFNIEKKEYNLTPTSSGKRLFIVFADLTSGEETYGAGRFLYIDAPDSNNNVVLDFNLAYNPPCAFTKYATCSLPPEENKLWIRITAGEKNYGIGH